MPACTIPGEDGPAWGVSFSPNGKKLAATFGDWREEKKLGLVKVWDAGSGQLIYSLKGQTGVNWAVAFSPDGRWVASGGGANLRPSEVKVWDTENGRLVFELPGHEGGVWGVGFSPDGSRLASVGGGSLKFWDMATRHPIIDEIEGSRDSGGMSALALSLDGRWAATSSTDRTVKIRDTASGKVVHTLQGHGSDVQGLAFSPDGGRLASCGMDRTVKVWDTTDGQELITLRGHTNGVYGVAFSPDGRRIVSSGLDGTVRVWDATPWVEPPASQNLQTFGAK
jgi:WD40 repeat protein